MRARLLGKTGAALGREFKISSQATIGKDRSNTIALPHKLISRRHARIYYDENQNSYFLEDLNSRNGTRLDGERILRRERLEHLHVITFSNRYDFFFQICGNEPQPKAKATRKEVKAEAENDAETETKTAEQSHGRTRPDHEGIKMPSRLLVDSEARPTQTGKTHTAATHTIVIPTKPESKPAQKRARAELSDYALDIAGIKQAFRLKQGANLIGRAPHCDVVLKHDSISRHHARISIRNGRVSIEDLNSKNRTFVAGSAIEATVEVGPDVTVRFGALDAFVQKNRR